MNRDEQGPTATVTATVKSKAQEEDGYKLELIIPSFKGQYPTTINRVPAEIAQRLITGKTYTLTLEQQNLRKKRDGTSYDGSQSWMYWWGLDDVPDQDKVLPEDAPWPLAADVVHATMEMIDEGTVPGWGNAAPDRQSLIMLQHASGVVAQAYGDWTRLSPTARVTFSEYLKAIAMGATWYLRNVYQKGGFSIQATEPVEEFDPPF